MSIRSEHLNSDTIPEITRHVGTTQQLLETRGRFYKFALYSGLINEADGEIITMIKSRATLDPNGKMCEKLKYKYSNRYFVNVKEILQPNGSTDFAIVSINNQTGQTESYPLIVCKGGITVDLEGMRTDLQSDYPFEKFEEGFIRRVIDHMHHSDEKGIPWETRTRIAAQRHEHNNAFPRGNDKRIRRGHRRYSS